MRSFAIAAALLVAVASPAAADHLEHAPEEGHDGGPCAEPDPSSACYPGPCPDGWVETGVLEHPCHDPAAGPDPWTEEHRDAYGLTEERQAQLNDMEERYAPAIDTPSTGVAPPPDASPSVEAPEAPEPAARELPATGVRETGLAALGAASVALGTWLLRRRP